MTLSVVHVCRVGWPRVGGMERAVHGLARTMLARGVDSRVVTLDRLSRDEPVLPAGVHEGVAYARVPHVGPARYPFGRGLRAAIRGADIVHVHGLDGLADVLVHHSPVPVGISTHGGYFHTDRLTVVKQAWLHTVTRVTLRRADAVWFTSEADRMRIGGRGEVLGNGVDVDRFAGTRAPLRRSWVVLGRVAPHKGIADLLPVLARVSDARLDVVGPWSDEAHAEALRRRAAELGVATRFRLWGGLPEDEVRARLMTASLALFPSHAEGFGIAAVECMGAGLPVVVGGDAALSELVRPGIDGFTTDFRDVDRAARDLERFDGEAAARSEAARDAAARYGWERMGERWETAYRTLAG